MNFMIKKIYMKKVVVMVAKRKVACTMEKENS